MERNIFELASQKKLRFNFKGTVTVEELWGSKVNDLYDLEAELTDLLNKQGTNRRNISMTPERELNELRLKIVTHIIDYKENMDKERKESIERTRELNRLLELMEKKKSVEEEKLTLEEVAARIAALRGK